MPAAYRLLQLNTNNLKNVNIFQIAISNYNGMQNFYLNKNGDTSSLMFNPNSERAIKVTTSTLDKEVSNLNRIDLIKIDVEGFELEVLQGSQNILKKTRPIVYFELLDGYAKARNIYFEDYYNFFKDYNYTLKYIDHSNSSNIISDDKSNMIVAIPNEKLILFN